MPASLLALEIEDLLSAQRSTNGRSLIATSVLNAKDMLTYDEKHAICQILHILSMDHPNYESVDIFGMAYSSTDQPWHQS